MTHADTRLARLVAALPPSMSKDAQAVPALSVQCAPGATWSVSGETISTTPVSGAAIRYNLRSYTLATLATAISAVGGYSATVVGGLDALSANILLDQVAGQGAAVSVVLSAYSALNHIVLGPVAAALDDFDDDFEHAVMQLNMLAAEAPWVDRWGELAGLPRLPSETDAIYGDRVRSAFVRAKQNGFGLVQTVRCSTRVTSAFVADNIYDGFTRIDNPSTLGNTDTGTTWMPLLGSWGVLSSKAYASQVLSAESGFAADHFGAQRFGQSSGAPVTSLGAEVVLDALWGDLPVQATFSTKATGQRLIFRHSGLGSEWWVECRADRYALVKNVSGAATDVGVYVVAPANGDVLKVTLAGSSITVFLNGVSRITATDSYNQTSTKAGMGLSDATASAARFDDFWVGTPGTFIFVSTMSGAATLQDQSNVKTTVNRYKSSGIIPTFVFQ